MVPSSLISNLVEQVLIEKAICLQSWVSLLIGLKAEDVENIVNVRLLDLRENKITQLPDEITCLQLLERLDVSNNDLSGLPFVLGLEFFNLYCKF